MNRRALREQVFKLLFRVEFNSPEDMQEQCRLFMEHDEVAMEEADMTHISEKYEAIADKLPEIDHMINERVEGWHTSRMGKVDLTIIRLALYEMKYDDRIPEGVAINEAVELAKKFGQDASPGFVNGILARFTA
ncbi:MAG: transcription antitermination factor NusB [Lachnospiraceae bacterium]|nr:transcription antitermination factor NusB [Lachnospiraceae bacterium]